ncbi:MAG TPA: Ig-like domain-containing protein, partial [Thermoplasmata archaeon]|nr:Ig-like domain-containing protein [Thermoplasmata archaeon]
PAIGAAADGGESETAPRDSPTGAPCETRWTDLCRTWGGPLPDVGYSIAADLTGVYIAGETWAAKDDIDGVLLKYSLDGDPLWARTWSKPGEDRLHGVATWNGSVYATGWTKNATGGVSDALLLKYDRDGNLLWNATWGQGDEDNSRAVLASAQGIFITGETKSPDPLKWDGFLAKFTHTGQLSSVALMSEPGDDRPWAIAAEGDRIIISGSSRSPTEDLTLWRFEKDLTPVSKFVTGGSGIEAAWSVSTLPGEAFAGGFTDSYGNGMDAILYYESPNGSWNKTWGGVKWDSAYAVSAQPDYLYALIATHSIGNGGGDPALMKLTRAGEQEWFFPWGGGEEDSGLGIAFVGSRAYLTGYTNSYGNGSRDIYLIRYTDTTAPRALERAEIRPAEAQVAVGSSELFLGRAVDQWGQSITEATMSWSISGDVGSVNGMGAFLASKAGTGEVRVKVSYRGQALEASARVEVYDPADITPPTVLWTDPADGSRAVRPGSRVAVGFSEPMDRNRTQDAFRIDPFTTGSFEWAGSELRFALAVPLKAGTDYRITIGNDSADLAGNRLGNEVAFGFRTEDPVFLPRGDTALQIAGGALMLAAVLAISLVIIASARHRSPTPGRKR